MKESSIVVSRKDSNQNESHVTELEEIVLSSSVYCKSSISRRS